MPPKMLEDEDIVSGEAAAKAKANPKDPKRATGTDV